MSGDLVTAIEQAWEARDSVTPASTDVRAHVDAALALLDSGQARVAQPDGNGGWQVNQWLKKAVLLSFRINDFGLISNGPGPSSWWDKVPSKFDNWGETEFRAAGFRAVPNCVVRRSAYIAPDVVLTEPSDGSDYVLIGSGDREDPFNTATGNWLYTIRDRDTASGKTLTDTGVNGVIASEAGRHPFPPMHPAVRSGLIDTAKRLDPLVLRWGK